MATLTVLKFSTAQGARDDALYAREPAKAAVDPDS